MTRRSANPEFEYGRKKRVATIMGQLRGEGQSDTVDAKPTTTVMDLYRTSKELKEFEAGRRRSQAPSGTPTKRPTENSPAASDSDMVRRFKRDALGEAKSYYT